MQSWAPTIDPGVIVHVQAALLAGRTNKALVGREEFSQAVLRSVAGIEKKRSILQGLEKDVVARHEVRTVFCCAVLSARAYITWGAAQRCLLQRLVLA